MKSIATILAVFFLAMVFSTAVLADPYEGRPHEWRNDNVFQKQVTFNGPIVMDEDVVLMDEAGKETLFTGIPKVFGDEFLFANRTMLNSNSSGGTAIPSTYDSLVYVKWDGGEGVAGLANATSGAVNASMSSTTGSQGFALHMNNNLSIDGSAGFIWEARVKFQELFNGTAEVQFGVGEAYPVYSNGLLAPATWANADDLDQFIGFDVDTSVSTNGLYVHVKGDGTEEKFDTGTNLAAETWYVFKIDARNPYDLRFYVDGQDVFNGTPIQYTEMAADILQPLIIGEKSSTNSGELHIDYMNVWQDRE